MEKEKKEIFTKNIVAKEDLQRVNERIDEIILEQEKIRSNINAMSIARREIRMKIDDMHKSILDNEIEISEVRIISHANKKSYGIIFWIALFTLISSISSLFLVSIK